MCLRQVDRGVGGTSIVRVRRGRSGNEAERDFGRQGVDRVDLPVEGFVIVDIRRNRERVCGEEAVGAIRKGIVDSVLPEAPLPVEDDPKVGLEAKSRLTAVGPDLHGVENAPVDGLPVLRFP